MATDSTTRNLRRANRSRVLRALVRDGETSRGQLAASLGLSLGTVTNVVADLSSEGLVHETGSLPSDGGRPTTLLSVNPGGAHFVGADVGEQGVTVEVFDLGLTAISSVFRNVSSRSAAPGELAALLSSTIDEAVAQAGGPASLYGVGLGMPGLVESAGDPFSGSGDITIYAQSLGWPATSLGALYSRNDLPIFADNGAKTLTMAETWFGAGRDVTTGLVALLGRGIGLGIVSEGRMLRGAASSAGEWGHTKVSIGGPECNCGSRGCLEAYVGGANIVRRWRDAGASPDVDDERAVSQLLAAAATGDGVAARVVDETIEILGIGLANLVNLFNPERIILGGWAGLALADTHLAPLATTTREHSLNRPAGQFDLVPATLGRDAVALGAALLAVENLIETPLSSLGRPLAERIAR